jgi:hypothetical protein
MQSNMFLKSEAKVEIVPRVGMYEPATVLNTAKNQMLIKIVEVLTCESPQPSRMTAPRVYYSMSSRHPSEDAQPETNASKKLFFITENVKSNVTMTNPLSVLSERTPEKNLEKNYLKLEDGCDTNDKIGLNFGSCAGEREIYGINDDLAALSLDTGEELGVMPELQLAVSN